MRSRQGGDFNGADHVGWVSEEHRQKKRGLGLCVFFYERRNTYSAFLSGGVFGGLELCQKPAEHRAAPRVVNFSGRVVFGAGTDETQILHNTPFALRSDKRSLVFMKKSTVILNVKMFLTVT